MEGVFVPFILFGSLFVALPWLILHYVTKWKQAPKITGEDEALLDELYRLARRLEDRVQTVERIVAADDPDFKPALADYARAPDYRLEQQSDYAKMGRK